MPKSPEMGPDLSIIEGQQEFENLSKEEQEKFIEAAHIEGNELNERINKNGEWDEKTLQAHLASITEPEEAHRINQEKQELLKSKVEELDQELQDSLKQIVEKIPSLYKGDSKSGAYYRSKIKGITPATVEKISVLTQANFYETEREDKEQGKIKDKGIILGPVQNRTVLLGYNGTLFCVGNYQFERGDAREIPREKYLKKTEEQISPGKEEGENQ